MELVFAKDIEFVKKTNNKSPQYYEDLIIKRCADLKLNFDGFILPWTGAKTKLIISNPENGLTQTINVNRMITSTNPGDKLKRANELHYKSEATKYLLNAGLEFIGWDGEYNKSNSLSTWCDAKCLIHGTTHRYLLRTIVQHKDKVKTKCVECYRINELTEKYGSVDAAIEDQEKRVFDIVSKLGYEIKHFTGDRLRDSETDVVLYCPKHGVEFSRNVCDLVYKKFVYCPTCISVNKGMRSGIIHSSNIGASKPTSIYLQNLSDKFCKFGVSVRPKVRMYEQQKVSQYNHSLVYVHTFEKGWMAADVEYGIKLNFKGRGASPTAVPDGYTETRDISMLDSIKQFIENYIRENPETPLYLTEI